MKRLIALAALLFAPLVFTFTFGQLQSGNQFSLTNPNLAGQILYTLDDEDPRLIGGTVSPEAKVFQTTAALTAEITTRIVTAKSVMLRARVHDGREWSALLEIELRAAAGCRLAARHA